MDTNIEQNEYSRFAMDHTKKKNDTHNEITDKVKHGKELLEYKNFGVLDDFDLSFAFTFCAFIFA